MKKLILKPFLLVLFSCFPCINFAQSYFDIAHISLEHAEYWPKNESGFSFNRFQAKINLGIELKNEDYILGALSGEVFKFQNIEYSEAGPDLYSNFVTGGYLHFWNEKKWSLVTEIRFKLNSDYHKPVFNDIQTGGWFLVTHKARGFDWFAGMYFNQEVNENLIFPIGGIYWIPNERLNLYVLVPSVIRLEYTLEENKWFTGLETQWNLNTYLINEISETEFFRKETLVTSIFLEKNITRNLVLRANIGHYQINKFEAFNANDELIPQSQLDSKLIQNLSLKAGIAYRMRL